MNEIILDGILSERMDIAMSKLDEIYDFNQLYML